MGGGGCEWEVRYGCKNGNECQYVEEDVTGRWRCEGGECEWEVEGVSAGPDISSHMTFN